MSVLTAAESVASQPLGHAPGLKVKDPARRHGCVLDDLTNATIVNQTAAAHGYVLPLPGKPPPTQSCCLDSDGWRGNTPTSFGNGFTEMQCMIRVR